MNEEKKEFAENIDNERKGYGKFKSAEELLKAYNALEGEFTRRSQKLAELEKGSTDTWEGKVDSFVKEYPIADTFADEVAEEITKNGKKIDKNNLERALLTVLSKKVKTADEMARDERVITKVLSDDRNKTAVIDDYLEGVRKNSPPTTLPRGGATPITAPMSMHTIKDAGNVALKILNE